MSERARPRHDARATPTNGIGLSDEAGTTLLDVVVATTLLLVILLPATQLLVTSGRVVRGSKVPAVAQNVASSQLNRATSRPPPTPPTAST